MAIKPLNSVAGFSVGETPANVILANGDITTGNATLTANVTAGNVKTDHLLYANGDPYVFTTNAAGTNTQIQFNNANAFGASSNLTFNTATNTLAAAGNITGGNVYANSGTIGASYLTGTLTTNAQPNVTSVGRLTGLVVGNSSNNVTFNYDGNGSLSATGNISALNIIGNIVGNLVVPGSNTAVVFNDDGNANSSTAFTFDKVSNLVTITSNANIGNVNTTGLISATGNITGGNLTTGGLVTATGNVRGANLTTGGLITATGNITGGNLLTGGLVSATGNLTGGNVTTTGLVSASGNVTGGNLVTTGTANIGNLKISGVVTGDLIPEVNYGGNLGNTTNKWKDLWLSGSTIYIGAQTISTDGDGITFTNTVFATNLVISSLANVGNLESHGIVSATGNVTGSNLITTGNAYVENIVNTTGGTTIGMGNGSGIISLTSAGNSTQFLPSGQINLGGASQITGGTFSGSILQLDTAQTNLKQLRGGNVTVQTGTGGTTANTWTFAQDGSFTSPGNITTTANANVGNVNTGIVSATGNITGGNIKTTGIANVGSLKVTGTSNLGPNSNVTITGGANGQYLQTDGAGNLAWATISSTSIANGNSNVSIPVGNGNIAMSVSGNANIVIVTGTGANVNGTLDVSGNLTTGNANLGNLVQASYANITATAKIYQEQLTSVSSTQVIFANGSSYLVGNSTFTFDDNTGTLSAPIANISGNITGGNIKVTGLANVGSLTVNGISNLGPNGNVIITGGASGQYLQTDGTGNLAWQSISTSSISNGNSNVSVISNGNITISAIGNSNIVVVTGTGANVNGTLSVSGNANIGNIGTAGIITATGNISGGNLSTAGDLNVTGTANVGNLTITGNSSVTGNVSGGNLTTTGLVSATGNISGGNLTTAGALSVTGNANVGNIGAANAVFTGTLSTTGNANVGNIGTVGLITATGNIQGGNLVTGGNVSATGNVSGGNVLTNAVIGTDLTLTSTGNLVLSPSGNIDANSNWINNVAYPNAASDAATKAYVDTVASSGINYHQPVYAATTTTLATATGGTTAYNSPNGAANGIGAYISTTGTFNLIDTANVQTVGTRILVKDEANAAWNGVYTYANTTAIVRSADADEYGPDSTEQLSLNDYFFTQDGTVNKGSAFVVSSPAGTITFGTSNIVFSLFSTSKVYSAGTGLTLAANNEFSISNTSVTSGSYGDGDNVATFTVNDQGQLTAASNVSITANAANLTGTTLNAAIVTSSLTSVGTLSSLSVSGNANIGNIGTGGLITATGNLNAGNIITAGIVSATGNGTFGNLSTTGSGGNISGANVISANTFTATANITGGNLISTGTLSVSGDANVGNIGATLGVFTGNISTNTAVSIGNTATTWGTVTTSSIDANQTISSLQITGTTISGVEFIVKGVDTLGTKYSVATVMAVTDGSTVDYSTFGTVNLGGFTGSLVVNITTSGPNSNIELQVTPASTNSTVWTTQYRVI